MSPIPNHYGKRRHSRDNLSIVDCTDAQQTIISVENESNRTTDAIDQIELKTTEKSKRRAVTAKPKRQAKLRPEDAHTLKILGEKFQLSEKGGMDCQIEKCNSSLACHKPSNLKRHIEQRHKVEFAQLFPGEISAKKRSQLDAYNSLQDAIELVTVNGYPFAMLNASGMRGFIKSRVQPLRSQGHVVEINRQKIAQKVAEASDIIRNRIKTEVSGKTVSVMFDVCTISTLSTFGVNVTYMENSKVVCRTLGISKIDERHTAVNLADMLFDLLEKYGISLFKVLSITTDTARNATNTTHVLNMVMAESNQNTEDITFDVEPDDDMYYGIDIENENELMLEN